MGWHALNALNTAAVNGKIALIDRGTCSFPEKIKNVKNAGAVGAILVDNVASSPPPGLGGTDPTVTISSVRISLADGAKLKSALATRSRLHAGVFVNLDANPTQLQGADETGRLLLYTPQPLDSGFSIAHWDQSAIRDLLMEPPPVAAGLTHSVTAPQDLTMYLLKDIGW